jgi:dipeptidyl aminopeptidase/acylaminoacyl peptidase
MSHPSKSAQTLLAFAILSLFAAAVVAQAPTLVWNEEGTRALYGLDENDGKQFFLVDIAKRSKQPAFDRKEVTAAMQAQTKDKAGPARLKILSIEFTDDPKTLRLFSAKQAWDWNPQTKSLRLTEGNQRPEGKLYLPPRPSGESNQRTNVLFVNQLDQEIELFWFDQNRRTRSYGTVQPGEENDMSTYVGHVWLFKDSQGKPLASYTAQANDRVVITPDAIGRLADKANEIVPRRRDRRNRNSRRNGSSKWQAAVIDHNLWLNPIGEERSNREPIQLADDASESNSFSRDPKGSSSGTPEIRWSPNSDYLIAYQRKPVTVRKVRFLESSPRDQLQPKLQEYTYPKPGDPLETKTLRLFSIEDQKEIPVTNELFKNPYRLQFVKWSDDGKRFWLHYNQRGHQAIRLLEVETDTGQTRTVAENTSNTFLEYTVRSKTFYQFIENDQLLWASQRTGWNHIYRIDQTNGQVMNEVTSGDWNVKRIERVDEEKKQIWFYAVGVAEGQDPYHEHFCRVDFDGRNFKVLTEGDGTHRVEWALDRRYLIDTWSRVDLAPVIELRDGESGQLICELKREDTSKQFRGRPVTTRFSALGRDGKTEIWGIIHFPRDFDPDKSYPVVENIYAGPHDHHVPKSFRSRYSTQWRVADAGMIVVQIDGMGTAWRSKAFHDVCYKNLRDAGFPDRIAWMKAAAKKYPQMDVSRVGIYGGSAGGQNAMAALLWHNDFYSVAVADCGCHDNRMDKMWWNEQWMGYPIDDSYIQNSNMENAHLLEGHLMLTVGEADRNVDPASTTQVVNALIKADKDFEFVLVPGGGHGVGESRWASRKRLNFLKRHLGLE